MMVDMIWGRKMALVIVDPQRKFSLKVPDWDERMGSAVEGMNRFSRIFRRYGAPVILVRFEGASHCSYEGDDGDDWLPGLETSPSDIVVPKRNMSCFKETDLLKVMQENGIDCALVHRDADGVLRHQHLLRIFGEGRDALYGQGSHDRVQFQWQRGRPGGLQHRGREDRGEAPVRGAARARHAFRVTGSARLPKALSSHVTSY